MERFLPYNSDRGIEIKMRRIVKDIPQCLIGLSFLIFAGCATTDRFIVYGRIAIKGNEPFTYVSLTDENGVEYELSGTLSKTLGETSQGKMIMIEAYVVEDAIGSGRPAKIEIIRVISQ